MSETLPALASRTPTDLIRWGKTAIEEAASFIATKEIRDQAEALRAYQRSVGAAQEAVDAAQEIRVRAERRMGQEIARAQRDGSAATPYRRQKGSDAPTLSEMGVTKHQSSEWQQLAAVDDETFDTTLRTAKEKGRLSPTTVRVLLRERRREADTAKQRAGKSKRAKGRTVRGRAPAWRPPTPEEEADGRVTQLFQQVGRIAELIERLGSPAEVADLSAKRQKGFGGHRRFDPKQLRRITDFLTALAAAAEERP